MSYITGFDRTHTALFHQSNDELIASDNPSRLIDLFVDALDICDLLVPIKK